MSVAGIVSRSPLFLIITMALLLLLAAPAAMAQPNPVNLAWDPNTDPDIAKYRIYRGNVPGGPYSQIGEVNHPTITYSDTTIQFGVTYYYVATAVYSSPSGESGYSNEDGGRCVGGWAPGLPIPGRAGAHFFRSGIASRAGDSTRVVWHERRLLLSVCQNRG